MSLRPYPHFSSPRPRDGAHWTVTCVWAEGAEPEVFCGNGRCAGECGLPALVIPILGHPANGRQFVKAHGSYVACGNVFQWPRVAWTGSVVEVPPEMRGTCQSRFWF